MNLGKSKPSAASTYEDLQVADSSIQEGSQLYRRFAKRVLDIVLVMLFAPMALLIVGASVLAIMMDGGKPIYFQYRIGKNGRKFRMYKLRTMVLDADEQLESYLAEHPQEREEWRLNQKLKVDPRVTAFGRILRKTSMDELPQLFNVLKGEMSIVGPRPMMDGQQKLYPGNVYYKMKPGLTGYWQISARNDCQFRDRAVYDAQYYREMSLATDLLVLLKTVGPVIRGAGH